MILLGFLLALVVVVAAAYCVVYTMDITGKSEPIEKLRYVYGDYTIIVYRRTILYELIIKNEKELTTFYRTAVHVWTPHLMMGYIAYLNLLPTAELIALSKKFEEAKLGVF